MPRATWVQTNFNGGEWSPLAWGRFDIAKYKNGLSQCKNWLPTQQGGLTRRPGTRFVAAVKNSTYAPRLQRFEFSTTQAYILEFGDHYIRFYTNDGQLSNQEAAWIAGHVYVIGNRVSYGGSNYQCTVNNTSGSSFTVDKPLYWVIDATPIGPLEVATNYLLSDVWKLDFAQSADTLYIVHPNYPPAKLQRASALSWMWNNISQLDGPYLPVNTTTTTLTPSGTSGIILVTASSIVGINGGVGFRLGPGTPGPGDAGRHIRLKCGGVWIWGSIFGCANALSCTVSVEGASGQYAPRQATAIANVSGGSVFTITITDGGSGYGAQPPNVAILPRTADPAIITLTIGTGGVIATATLFHAGSGYTSSPTVVINSITGSGGIIYAHVLGGVVDNVYLAAGGTGYTAGDTTTVSGGGSGGGSGAVAYAALTNGVVTAVVMSVTGTGYTSGADVVLSAPTALVPATTTFWRLGEWGGVDGYPSHVVFHQDRLCFSGNPQNPGRVDASNTGDYENFAPTNIDGTVVDSNALAFTLNSGVVNAIQWIVSNEFGLLIGTAGGEWMVAASSLQQAITPTNINAKPIGQFGSTPVKPLVISKAVIFVQRTTRKLREVTYQFIYNTFQAIDISLVSEHLTKGGLKQMDIQLAPQQIIWVCRNDGTLVGVTYDKDQDIVGWHQHALGGFSDAAHTLPPLVESVVTLPAPGVQRDEVWLLVNRYINGATSRTVEVMTKLWEDGDTLPNAVFLDSSSSYSGAPTTTISGLTWLPGQTVGVLADGATHPDCVVDATGHITLTRSATVAQVGLKYSSQGKTLPIEAGGADGPSQGKIKRVFRVIWRFFQTLSLNQGTDDPTAGTEPLSFRDSSMPMDAPPILFTGDMRQSYEGTWNMDGRIYFEVNDPLPANITLLVAQVDTQDGS